LLFMMAIYVVSQLMARGYPLDSSAIVVTMTGVLLVVIGNFMGKIRPNWFVGIRTPWTLSSKVSWDRTHRLGGWLFIVGGIAMIASVAAPSSLRIGICASVPFAIVGICFVYSYFLWRADPDKQSPAGTVPAHNP